MSASVTSHRMARRPVLGHQEAQINRTFYSCKRLRSKEINSNLCSHLQIINTRLDEAGVARELGDYVRALVRERLSGSADLATMLDCAILSWVVARALEDIDAKACEEHINQVCFSV